MYQTNILLTKSAILMVIIFYTSQFQLNAQRITGGQKPFAISGHISGGGFIYSQNGGVDRQSPQGYSLNAMVNLSVYGVQIPIYASINEQGSYLENPFNRFGISPHYKWAKLHLGWRFMQFSQFTMSGINFFGGGMELTPGRWRISAMKGRFQEATDGSNPNYFGPHYQRNGWAAKLGYGTNRSFIDFLIFKAKDDINSINLADTLSASAHENLSLGIKGQLQIIPKYLSLYLDGGVSAFTEDLRSDTLPDEAQKYVEVFSSIYEPNISSHFNYALVGGTQLTVKSLTTKIEYRRVMPEYRSLGVNYLLNDVEAITLQPNVQLMSNKLVIGGSFGIQRNNIDDLRQNQNQRNIGSIQIQYNPQPIYGISAQYSNYSFSQQLVRDTLFGDSLVLDQVNQNIVLTPRYLIMNKNNTHSFVLNYNWQKLTDRIIREGNNFENNMHLLTMNYSWNRKKTKTRLNLGSNFLFFDSGLAEIKRLGWSAGIRQSIFKQKLSIQFNTGYQHSLIINNSSLYGGLNLSWKIYKKLSMSINSRFRIANSSGNKQNEIRSELRLKQRF